MKGAIMQPYFFPYIGYYQLAYEVDTYVFLDDVNFIKKGYINRNAILLQGRRHAFSIPVSQLSQNRTIQLHDYQDDLSSFLRLVQQAYRKAPFFDTVMPLIESVAMDPDNNVARKNAKSLTAVFAYLGLERVFLFSSEVASCGVQKGQDRIIALCRQLGIDQYRNAIGGQMLYDGTAFQEAGIELRFIQSNMQPYPQGKGDFVAHLSIIDALMHCDRQTLIELIGAYSLV